VIETQLQTTPAEVSQRFAEAITAGDLEAALGCWSPDAVLVPPHESEVRGRYALAALFQVLIDSNAKMQIAVSDEVCTELGAIATTHMTTTLGAGDDATVAEATAVVVYVPGTNGLQILIDRVMSHDG
jgi:ketosteroid isomerase-like protein